MKSLIDKNKQISPKRKEYVEHNFEAMVGARKRRYNDTPQQKQKTEFFEDYYLLYTRTKDKWQKLKDFIKTYQEDVVWKNKQVDEFQEELLDKMQELEGEDD